MGRLIGKEVIEPRARRSGSDVADAAACRARPDDDGAMV
jgi:hypothetical protein